MKRNALCDGVHKASRTGDRERLGQPATGDAMIKINGKHDSLIVFVERPDDPMKAIRTVLIESLTEIDKRERKIHIIILPKCHSHHQSVNKKQGKSLAPNASRVMRYILAVISFFFGITIALTGLFIIPPIGDIPNTTISVVSELLILSGAMLGTEQWKKHT